MMDSKKVVILTGSTEQNERLSEAFQQEGFIVCGVSQDGAEGVRLIEQHRPDAVVCELFLRNLDGMGIMTEVGKKQQDTAFVVILSTADDSLAERAMKKGARYCLIKPFTAENAVERTKEILESVPKPTERGTKIGSIDEKVSNIFISIGIPPHIKGYGYLREGIKMAVEDPGIINNVTKVLYPKIGEKFDTSASKVERAIRHAIEVAWNRGRIDAINSIFGARVYIGTEKPTNSEFIALVADKLILESMV